MVPVTTLVEEKKDKFQEAIEKELDELDKKNPKETPEELEKEKDQPKEVTPAADGRESMPALESQDTANWPLGDNWRFHDFT